METTVADYGVFKVVYLNGEPIFDLYPYEDYVACVSADRNRIIAKFKLKCLK
jgi:hypothetical protein